MIGRKERELFTMALERHLVEEEHILTEYRNLAAKVNIGPAALLIYTILTDENHQHFLLRELAKRLGESTAETRTPAIQEAFRPELLGAIKTLRKHEDATIEECRQLKSQVVTEEIELFDAMLNALISDSGKNRRLLTALETTVKS